MATKTTQDMPVPHSIGQIDAQSSSKPVIPPVATDGKLAKYDIVWVVDANGGAGPLTRGRISIAASDPEASLQEDTICIAHFTYGDWAATFECKRSPQDRYSNFGVMQMSSKLKQVCLGGRYHRQPDLKATETKDENGNAFLNFITRIQPIPGRQNVKINCWAKRRVDHKVRARLTDDELKSRFWDNNNDVHDDKDDGRRTAAVEKGESTKQKHAEMGGGKKNDRGHATTVEKGKNVQRDHTTMKEGTKDTGPYNPFAERKGRPKRRYVVIDDEDDDDYNYGGSTTGIWIKGGVEWEDTETEGAHNAAMKEGKKDNGGYNPFAEKKGILKRKHAAIDNDEEDDNTYNHDGNTKKRGVKWLDAKTEGAYKGAAEPDRPKPKKGPYDYLLE